MWDSKDGMSIESPIGVVLLTTLLFVLGASLATAERMAQASPTWAADPTKEQTIAGARGALGPAGIPIHSVRMRGIVAHQEVILGTTGQTLTLRHDSYDRSSFMPGVVLAAKRIATVPGLTVGLDAVLGL